MWENNPEWYKHEAPKYAPKWEKDVDYNPDHNPSGSVTHTAVVGEQARLVRVWHVRGLGVLVAEMRGTEVGSLEPKGLSLFTKDEIGWSPTL